MPATDGRHNAPSTRWKRWAVYAFVVALLGIGYGCSSYVHSGDGACLAWGERGEIATCRVKELGE